MSKYFSIFFLNIGISVLLFIGLGIFGFSGTGDTFVLLVGVIITLQLSFVIALLFYVLDRIKQVSRR